MTKDKSSIEIETSHVPTPRPYIVDVIRTLYRTRDKKVITVYIITYSDGRICKFEKEEREDDRASRLKAVTRKFKELVEKREGIQNEGR
jgi:hypothetical protein